MREKQKASSRIDCSQFPENGVSHTGRKVVFSPYGPQNRISMRRYLAGAHIMDFHLTPIRTDRYLGADQTRH
jgi:hypothetical protein